MYVLCTCVCVEEGKPLFNHSRKPLMFTSCNNNSRCYFCLLGLKSLGPAFIVTVTIGYQYFCLLNTKRNFVFLKIETAL